MESRENLTKRKIVIAGPLDYINFILPSLRIGKTDQRIKTNDESKACQIDRTIYQIHYTIVFSADTDNTVFFANHLPDAHLIIYDDAKLSQSSLEMLKSSENAKLIIKQPALKFIEHVEIADEDDDENQNHAKENIRHEKLWEKITLKITDGSTLPIKKNIVYILANHLFTKKILNQLNDFLSPIVAPQNMVDEFSYTYKKLEYHLICFDNLSLEDYLNTLSHHSVILFSKNDFSSDQCEKIKSSAINHICKIVSISDPPNFKISRKEIKHLVFEAHHQKNLDQADFTFIDNTIKNIDKHQTNVQSVREVNVLLVGSADLVNSFLHKLNVLNDQIYIANNGIFDSKKENVNFMFHYSEKEKTEFYKKQLNHFYQIQDPSLIILLHHNDPNKTLDFEKKISTYDPLKSNILSFDCANELDKELLWNMIFEMIPQATNSHSPFYSTQNKELLFKPKVPDLPKECESKKEKKKQVRFDSQQRTHFQPRIYFY